MGNNRLGLRLKGTQSPVAKHTALQNTKSAIGRFSEGGLHEKIASLWGKMRSGASYSTSNKLLLVARHILTTGLQKCL